MSFAPRILTPKQLEILTGLGPVATRLGFYLAGGTAVALRLGHRRSEDFDWFTDRPFDPLSLAADLREEGVRFRTTLQAPHTLWGTIRGVKTSLIQFRYPPLRTPTRWPRFGIRIASLEDLATMKLSAIVKRGSRKDFVDVHAIATSSSGLPLARMLSLYQKRFRTADVAHVLYALTYFADADAERMPRMLRAVTWNAVKRTITRRVVELG